MSGLQNVEDEPRVLATVYIDKHCVEVVEHSDGRSEITRDGVVDCQWASGQIDACMESFVHMLRRRVPIQ